MAAVVFFACASDAVARESYATVPLFSISKSENKNQVQYVVRVDGDCAPAGAAPAFSFWRMRERGADVTEGMLSREVPAYGVASQTVTERRTDGGAVLVRLNAFPDRPIVVVTGRAANGRCEATSTVVVDGLPAHLFNVHVALKWPFGVDYLLLSGWTLDGSHLVEEKVKR